MKRTPITRKTPLIRNRATLARKKFIRKVSKRRAAENKIYSRDRIEFLSENDICEVCQSQHATEIHHRRGRIAANYLDKSTWIPICRDCHTMVENNKTWAREKGFIENKHLNYPKPD